MSSGLGDVYNRQVVEESIDPQASCEHEESSLAKLYFSELLINSEVPSVDPNEVEAGFEEPDVFHANAARSALSFFPTVGSEDCLFYIFDLAVDVSA